MAKRYTDEFRRDAVRMATTSDDGPGILSVQINLLGQIIPIPRNSDSSRIPKSVIL